MNVIDVVDVVDVVDAMVVAGKGNLAATAILTAIFMPIRLSGTFWA